MNYVQTQTEFSEKVIYEDEEDKIENNHKSIFIETEEEDDSTKKGNIFMGHIINKLNKNLGIIFSIIFMILIYYFIIFESIIPIYESEMNKNYLKQNNKIKQSPETFPAIFLSNKGISYLMIFNFLFVMFAIGFIKLAIYDPGRYDEDYIKLYSLKKYAIMYSNFVYRILFPPIKNKKDYNSNKSRENINYPFIQLKSKDVLKQDKVKNVDSDEDSIIVDPDDQMKILNKKLKEFNKELIKFRKNNNLDKFWNLNCFNFRSLSIKENVCRFCLIIKSERSFHCKNCRQCVRKMDHHCVYINNCVGMKTYKLFIIMLFYGSLLGCYSMMIMIESLQFILSEYQICYYTVFYVFVLIVVGVIGSMIFYYFIFHIILTLKGLTQLEHMFAYDLRYGNYYGYFKRISLWKKFTSVFGKNPFLWFFPFDSPLQKMDGYVFSSK